MDADNLTHIISGTDMLCALIPGRIQTTTMHLAMGQNVSALCYKCVYTITTTNDPFYRTFITKEYLRLLIGQVVDEGHQW